MDPNLRLDYFTPPSDLPLRGKILLGYVAITPEEDRELASVQTVNSTLERIEQRIATESQEVQTLEGVK